MVYPLKTKYTKREGLSNSNLHEILSQNDFTPVDLPALIDDVELIANRVKMRE
jgi:hypothetical protein